MGLALRVLFSTVAILSTILVSASLLGCMGGMGPATLAADCEPLVARTCSCSDGNTGVQTCNAAGDAWEACRCTCDPGELAECPFSVDETGLRECHATGEFWLPCQNLDEAEILRRNASRQDDPRCDAGEAYCPDIGCVNLANSSSSCGLCGRACEGCDRCFRGECMPVCCDSETNCGTEWTPECSDLESDPNNCGACGVACVGDEVCVAGNCVS